MLKKNESPTEVPMKTELHEIERIGTKLVIPEGLALRDLLDMIRKMIHDEEQEYQVVVDFDILLPEGMIAFDQATKEVFGWSIGKTTHSFFGSNPPTKVNIEISHDKSTQASFGPIETPGLDGTLNVAFYMKDGLPKLRVLVNVLNKHRSRVDLLCTRIREIAKNNSIYRGNAIYLPVIDNDAECPITDRFPRFLDLSNINVDELIFNDDIANTIEDNLFGPVRYSEYFRQHKIPLKTGVLMTGPYGCGKTLTALALAKVAIQNGWTFFLVKDAKNLKTTMDFAMNYQPCVIFCEDIDRVMTETTLGRTEQIDSILNTIDGIMAKSSEMMVVLTTNHIEKISQPMLRAGRLDIILKIDPPSGTAVDRLIHQYARGLLPVSEDLSKVREMMSGQIPAMIREVVERSKRSAIASGRITANGNMTLRASDLERAASGLMNHLDLLKEKTIDNRSEIEKAASIIANSMSTSHLDSQLQDAINSMEHSADEIEFMISDASKFIKSIMSPNLHLENIDTITDSVIKAS